MVCSNLGHITDIYWDIGQGVLKLDMVEAHGHNNKPNNITFFQNSISRCAQRQFWMYFKVKCKKKKV